MAFRPYEGREYLDFEEVERWCLAAAEAYPDWVECEEVGRSRHDRPLWLVTIGRRGDGDGTTGTREQRPAIWLDGGTHASEWTGVSATLYAMSEWIEGIDGGDGPLAGWFAEHTAYVMPCISPDGYQALRDGEPFLRSTLRPPAEGHPRTGFEPSDVDGDGVVRWMRWKHPAGGHVPDEDNPLFMRPRTLDDDPGEAYFFCDEGEFLNWDGVRWTSAPRQFGLDLNRNFPAHWEPFSMFGMDSGDYPISEPESRAVVDTFAQRANIAAAVTYHTYTGCVLTQPYRKDSPLDEGDIRLMEELAHDAVEGTDYDVFRVYPDFMYDPDKPTVGVWSDTISTVFGVPGYTIELWDPFDHAGVELPSIVDFFSRPDPQIIGAILAKFAEDHPESLTDWRPFDHPQIGEVEIGGIDYLHTVRNPPVALLERECGRGFDIAERVRRSLPRVRSEVRVDALDGEVSILEVMLENTGFLPTSGLRRGAEVGAAPGVSVGLECGRGVEVIEGAAEQSLDHLEGWGALRVGSGAHSIYPDLSDRGHRDTARWVLRGAGEVTLSWVAGRAGRGARAVSIEPTE